jgi:hypothetical protein
MFMSYLYSKLPETGVPPHIGTGGYQPIVWPIKVERNAPAIPRTVVRMKPDGLFGPDETRRAMIPAKKPIKMIQSRFDTITSRDRGRYAPNSYSEPDSAVLSFRPTRAAV